VPRSAASAHRGWIAEFVRASDVRSCLHQPIRRAEGSGTDHRTNPTRATDRRFLLRSVPMNPARSNSPV
jgi:hypothetical protein